MAVSHIKRTDAAFNVPFRNYDNATMAQILADVHEWEFGFALNINVEASKRPSGITAGFYYAIIPRVSYVSGSAFAIVWSNLDNLHVVSFG